MWSRWYENDLFILKQRELIFSKKAFVLSLVLKATVFGTRQWPIVKYVYRILPLCPICPEEYLSLYQIPEFLKKVYINIYGSFSNCLNFYSSQSQKCPCHCFGSVLLSLQTLPQYVIGLLCYYGLIFSQSELIYPCIYFLRFAPVTHVCFESWLVHGMAIVFCNWQSQTD